MTRKDYYLIAGAVKKLKSLGQDQLLYVADMLATDLKQNNPAFKRELFLKESGVSDDLIASTTKQD